MSNYPAEGAPLITGEGGPSEKMYPPPPGQYPIADQPPPYTPPQGLAPQQGMPPPGYQGYPSPQPQGYPSPQPQGYPPQPYPQHNIAQTPTVVVQPTVVVGNAANYGEIPINVICPYCHSNILTGMEYTSGTLAWILVCVLFFIGCWPFCLIPFCIDGCKDVTHKCPACQKSLGYFKRL